MAYPNLQITRPFAWYGDSLAFILQTTALATDIDINVYAAADTTFTTALYNDPDQTTDANGDYLGAVPITTRTVFPFGAYILRVTVGADHYQTAFCVERTAVYLQLLDSLLGGLKFIPRPSEIGALSLDKTYVRLPYGNIQLSPAPVFTKNDAAIIDGSVSKLDYAAGRLYFLNPITNGDDIRAEYRFSYLPDPEGYNFLRLGMHQANNKSPATAFRLTTAPIGWEYPVTLAAYRMVLRKLSTDLGTHQWRRVFEDPTGLLSNVQSMLAATGTELDALLTGIKRRGLLVPGVVKSADVANIPSLATGDGGMGDFRNFSVLGPA